MKKVLFFAMLPVLCLTLVLAKYAYAWHADADARCYSIGTMRYAAASAGAGGGLERNVAETKARMREWVNGEQIFRESKSKMGPTEGTDGASAYSLRIAENGDKASAYAQAYGWLLQDGWWQKKQATDVECD